jgi:hypothetical protein
LGRPRSNETLPPQTRSGSTTQQDAPPTLWVVEQREGDDCAHLRDYATKAAALRAAAKAVAKPGRLISKVVVWKNTKVRETEV